MCLSYTHFWIVRFTYSTLLNYKIIESIHIQNDKRLLIETIMSVLMIIFHNLQINIIYNKYNTLQHLVQFRYNVMNVSKVIGLDQFYNPNPSSLNREEANSTTIRIVYSSVLLYFLSFFYSITLFSLPSHFLLR